MPAGSQKPRGWNKLVQRLVDGWQVEDRKRRDKRGWLWGIRIRLGGRQERRLGEREIWETERGERWVTGENEKMGLKRIITANTLKLKAVCYLKCTFEHVLYLLTCVSVYDLWVQTFLFALRRLLNYMTPEADRRQTTKDEKVNNTRHVLQWSLEYDV